MIVRFAKPALVFFLLFTAFSSAVQANDTDTKTLLKNARLLLEQEKYPEAENLFQQILKQDKKCAEAYFGLGLIQTAKDSVSQKGEQYFQQAIKYDSNFEEARFHLATLYMCQNSFESNYQARREFERVVELNPAFTNAWQNLAEVERRLCSIGTGKDEVKVYEKALKANPDSPIFYTKYLEAAKWHSEEKRAIPILEMLIVTQPANPKFYLDLADIFLRLEESQKSSSLLDSLENNFSQYSKSQFYLLRAKNLFFQEKSSEGLVFYWQAIEAINDSADNRAIFLDLFYLMKNEEYELYRTAEIAQLPSFYRAFWQSRDPNLATPENERISEHYSRLFYARKNYRKYLKHYRHVDLGYTIGLQAKILGMEDIKEEPLSHLLPEAIAANQICDLSDLGLVYIKHGKPDVQIISSDEFDSLCMKISWKYSPAAHRPKMILHFILYSGAAGYRLCSGPFLNGRWELGGNYLHLDPGAQLPPVNQQDRFSTRGRNLQLIEELHEQIITDAQVSMEKETSDYEHKEELFELPFRLLCFKDENKNQLLEIYTLINHCQLAAVPDSEINRLQFSKFFGIFDSQWNRIYSIQKDTTADLIITPKQWKKAPAVDVERFSLKAGNYHCEIQYNDLNSNKVSVSKGPIEIPDYHQDQLMLSDVILSWPIQPANSRKSVFTKGEIKYSPHMFHAYLSGGLAGIYYEIYNLKYDVDGKTRFRVSYELSPNDSRKSKNIFARLGNLFLPESGSIRLSNQYQGTTTDEKIHMNFDLGKTPGGEYTLSIQVTDLVTNEESENVVPVKIQ